MNEKTNLIDEARKAGQDYIDSFQGDLAAVCADMHRRAVEEGRTIVSLPPKRPHNWENHSAASEATRKVKAG